MTREKVHQKALALLNRRALSSGMLRTRLRKYGASESDAHAVIADLTRAGLLNDDEYARMLIRRVLGRGPAGPAYVRKVLIKDMLEREVIECVLEEFSSARDQLKDAEEYARKKLNLLHGLEPDVVRRRLYGQLARRGFDPEICSEVISRILLEQS